MLNLFSNYLVKRANKRVSKLLNKKSGQPENSHDWRVRVGVCEELLNTQETYDKYTIIALKTLEKESEMMVELYDAKEVADYLIDFSNEKE